VADPVRNRCIPRSRVRIYFGSLKADVERQCREDCALTTGDDVSASNSAESSSFRAGRIDAGPIAHRDEQRDRQPTPEDQLSSRQRFKARRWRVDMNARLAPRCR